MELGDLLILIRGNNTSAKAAIRESTTDLSRLELHAQRTLGGVGQAAGIATPQMGALTGEMGKAGARMSLMLPVLGLTTLGIHQVTSAVSDSVKAFAQEEVGIERMTGLLRANLPAWNGDTAAIEKRIEARQRLSYDDAKLRDSFGTLVARTHDQTRAFELQSLSMDLARGKTLDLETASNIIGKVYSGNLGILTRYGIAVDKNATSEQALAAIQKTYMGQAAGYANTAAGAADRLDTALGNLSETLGGGLSPGLESSNNRFAEWVTDLDQGFQLVGGWIADAKLWAVDIGIAPDESLDRTLDKFNVTGRTIVESSKATGVDWSTNLVAGIGAGTVQVEAAVAGSVSAMDLTAAVQGIGLGMGQGYVLYMADGMWQKRKAVETEVGYAEALLDGAIGKLTKYQTLIATFRDSSDAHDRDMGRVRSLGELGTLAASEDASMLAAATPTSELLRYNETFRRSEETKRLAAIEDTRKKALQEAAKATKSAAAETAKAAKAEASEARSARSAIFEAADQTRAMSGAVSDWIKATTSLATFKLPSNFRPQMDILIESVNYSMMGMQKVALRYAQYDKEGKLKSLDFLTDWLGAARQGQGLISDTVQAYKGMETAIRPSRASIDAILVDQEYVFSRQKEAAAKYSVEQMALTQLYAQTNQSVFQSLTSVTQFTAGVQSQKEDVRGQIRLLFANADEVMRIFMQWSSTWKEENMERAARIGKNVGDVFSGINSAFQAVLSAQGASLVSDYEIDDAIANFEHMLGGVSRIMDSSVFQQDWARRAAAFSQGAGGLFATVKSGLDLAASMGDGQESSYEFAMEKKGGAPYMGPSPSVALGGYGGSGGSGSGSGSGSGGGGSIIYNNCIILPSGDVLIEDPDVERLVSKIRGRQTLKHGAVIGAGG